MLCVLQNKSRRKLNSQPAGYFLKDKPLIGIGLDASNTRLKDGRTNDLLAGKDATTNLKSSALLAWSSF